MKSEPARYMGLKEVAAHLGVTPGSLTHTALPQPDALTGTFRGWLPATIDAWIPTRPGKGGTPRKPAKAPDGMLTITQAAEALGISRQAIFLRIKSGALPSEKVGKIWAIPADAVKKTSRGRR